MLGDTNQISPAGHCWHLASREGHARLMDGITSPDLSVQRRGRGASTAIRVEVVRDTRCLPQICTGSASNILEFEGHQEPKTDYLECQNANSIEYCLVLLGCFSSGVDVSWTIRWCRLWMLDKCDLPANHIWCKFHIDLVASMHHMHPSETLSDRILQLSCLFPTLAEWLSRSTPCDHVNAGLYKHNCITKSNAPEMGRLGH